MTVTVENCKKRTELSRKAELIKTTHEEKKLGPSFHKATLNINRVCLEL